MGELKIPLSLCNAFAVKMSKSPARAFLSSFTTKLVVFHCPNINYFVWGELGILQSLFRKKKEDEMRRKKCPGGRVTHFDSYNIYNYTLGERERGILNSPTPPPQKPEIHEAITNW